MRTRSSVTRSALIPSGYSTWITPNSCPEATSGAEIVRTRADEQQRQLSVGDPHPRRAEPLEAQAGLRDRAALEDELLARALAAAALGVERGELERLRVDDPDAERAAGEQPLHPVRHRGEQLLLATSRPPPRGRPRAAPARSGPARRAPPRASESAWERLRATIAIASPRRERVSVTDWPEPQRDLDVARGAVGGHRHRAVLEQLAERSCRSPRARRRAARTPGSRRAG